VPTTIDEYSLATVPVIQLFDDTVLGNATTAVIFSRRGTR